MYTEAVPALFRDRKTPRAPGGLADVSSFQTLRWRGRSWLTLVMCWAVADLRQSDTDMQEIILSRQAVVK
jgi:hypothetical protein